MYEETLQEAHVQAILQNRRKNERGGGRKGSLPTNVTKKDKVSDSKHWYISSLCLDSAEEFSKGIRGHWSIEHPGLWAEMPPRDPPPLTRDSQEEGVYEPFDDGWPGFDEIAIGLN